MKKALLAMAAILFLAAPSFSQTDFILLPNDSISLTQTVAANDILEGFMKVKNISNSTKTIKWICSDKTGPHDWEVNICDIVNCYSFGYVVRSFNLAAGDTGTMRLDVDPHGASGAGFVSLLMWVDGDSANGKVKTPTWNVDINALTGIKNVSATSLKIFPNPVKNIFTVSGLENAGNLSFEVYDMKGSAVKSEVKAATNTTIDISIENLPQGIYVLKAFDKDGQIAGTSRLSKID
jgi:hypothetical protein